MKNETTKIFNYLKKVQQVASDQVYPGYPFRDSIIIDLDNDKCYFENGQECTFQEAIKEIKAECFDYILGCKGNSKGSWYLGNPKLESANEFASFDFDNDKLYIDEPLVARFYLAIMSARNEIVEKKLKDKIIFAEVDLNEEFISCKTFASLKEAKKLYQEWLDYCNE